MTITDTTPLAALPDLRALTDEELDAAWLAADVDNPAVFAAFMAESDQRTAAERAARAKERRDRAEQQLQSDWYDAMHAQRIRQFEAEGIGYLPAMPKANACGRERESRVSEWQLWTGQWSLVQQYGTDEMLGVFQAVAAAHARRVQAAAARSRPDPA